MFWNLYSRFFVGHRAWLTLAVVIMTVVSVCGLVVLKFDDRPHNLINAGEDYQLLEELNDQFGSDDNDIFLLVESDDVLNRKGVAALRFLVDEVKGMEDIASVQSLVGVQVYDDENDKPLPLLPAAEASDDEYQSARSTALAHPMVEKRLLSEDGRSTLVIARMKENVENIRQIEPVISEMRRLAKSAEEEFSVTAGLTGIPPIRVDIWNSIQRETIKFTIIALGLSTLMSLLLFRSFRMVVITCLGPWAGAVWTMGMMGVFGAQVNIINVVLPTLVVIVGFTNSIHLMLDIRRSLANGENVMDAAAGGIRQLGGACGLAAATTAVGFGSLVVADAEIIQDFGIVCGAGALLSFIAVITTVPLLSSVLLAKMEGRAIEGHTNHIGRGVDRMIDVVVRRPVWITVGGAALTAVLALCAMQLKPDSILTETIPESTDSARTLDRIDETLSGALTAIVMMEWPQREERVVAPRHFVDAMEDVEQAMLKHTHPADGSEAKLGPPTSVLNLLRSAKNDTSRYLSDLYRPLGLHLTQQALIDEQQRLESATDEEQARHERIAARRLPLDVRRRFVRIKDGDDKEIRRMIMTCRMTNIGASQYDNIFAELEKDLAGLKEKHAQFDFRLTGTPVVAARNINEIIIDLRNSLTLASLVIFGAITLTFRSPRLGLISILPNIFPLVAAGACLWLLGEPLQITSVIVFSICLGIAVDDTIHLINRFERELKIDGDVEKALRRASHAVGTALVTSTIVLVAGFASLMISNVPATLLFAWITCVGIGSALIGDLLILPAMLQWFARAPKTPAKEDPLSSHEERAELGPIQEAPAAN